MKSKKVYDHLATVNLTAQLRDDLQALSKHTGIPQSEIIRRALVYYFDNHDYPMKEISHAK